MPLSSVHCPSPRAFLSTSALDPRAHAMHIVAVAHTHTHATCHPPQLTASKATGRATPSPCGVVVPLCTLPHRLAFSPFSRAAALVQLSKANFNQGPSSAASGSGSSSRAGVLDELPARFRQPDIPSEEIAIIEVQRAGERRLHLRFRVSCAAPPLSKRTTRSAASERLPPLFSPPALLFFPCVAAWRRDRLGGLRAKM